MAYTVKSLRQIDGNYTRLLLFVKGASPIIPQLDQRRSARVSLEEARHVRLTCRCERGIQLIKQYFFKKFGDCRKDTDLSVIVLLVTSSFLWIGATLLIFQSLGRVLVPIQ